MRGVCVMGSDLVLVGSDVSTDLSIDRDVQVRVVEVWFDFFPFLHARVCVCFSVFAPMPPFTQAAVRDGGQERCGGRPTF